MKKIGFTLGSSALLLAVCSIPLAAATVGVNLGTVSNSATNTGTFANQAQVTEEMFTITSASSITMYTTSYGGGSNLNGTSSTAGGFQPSLILFNSAGNFVAGETFPSPRASSDPATHLALDAYLNVNSLAAGSYIVALTDWLDQQSPSATNLSAGFTSNLGSGGSAFVDAGGFSRTANYSFNLSVTPLTSPSAAPEPSTFALMIPAALGSLLWFRRRRASAKS